MIFKRAVQRYGQIPQADTPYQRAGQVWDERIGSTRVQARNWRLMAFGCLALSGGLASGLVWQSAQSRITPYVVEVDRLGEARAVSEAQAGYHPTDPQIAWHLSRFIGNVRSRSLDAVLVRQGWLEAYDFTTKRGAQFLGDYARAADPFAHIGERTVSVQVTSVVRASDRSFQVKWTETAYERGVQAGTQRWTAILTIVVRPPPRCGDAPQKPPWCLCRCGRLEPRTRSSSAVAPGPSACCPAACPGRLAAWLSPRSQSRCCHAAQPGDTPVKFILASCALAIIATSAQAQTPTPEPAHSPVATAKVSPPPKPQVRRTIARKRLNPVVVRVAAANRAATLEPQPQGFVNAVQVFPFSDGVIYQVYTAPGAVTDIALQPAEKLVAVAAGDTVRWVIGDTTSGTGADKRTHILVKPFTSGLATNLVVTTDRRSYHLQLTATSHIAMAALSWTYPADQLIALRRAADQAAAAAPVSDGLVVDNLHFNYAISGDAPAWRPLRAFDDGRQTFVEFPASIAVGDAPPLFVVGPTGEAELVNYRLRGRFYVVDRIFDAAELRLGTRKQLIVRIARIDDGTFSRKGKRS